MNNLGWIISGNRTLVELQHEAEERNIPFVGLRKDDLRTELVNHETARMTPAQEGGTPPTPQPAPTPAPAAAEQEPPAPAPVQTPENQQSPAIIHTLPNSGVQMTVRRFNPNNDMDILQQIAGLYGINPADKNFYVLRSEVLAFLEQDLTGSSPRAVHDLVVAWGNNHQPTTRPTEQNGDNNMRNKLLTAAAVVGAIALVVIAVLLFNQDDEDNIPTAPDATPTATSTNSDPTPTVAPTEEPTDDTDNETVSVSNDEDSGNNTLSAGGKPVYDAASFRHPNQFVDCQKTFEPVASDVDWITCEPGVLLTNTATFTRPEVNMVYHTNCPEGGFWYGSMHHGLINVKGVGVEVPDRGPGTNHLVLIRCALSDGKRDSDLNTTMDVGNFVIGHAIWSPIPANHPDGSAYVSMEWFGEQLVTSHTTGGTNCGSDGCSKVYVILYDVNSQSMQTFLVTDIVGETSDADGDGIIDYANANWELIESNR